MEPSDDYKLLRILWEICNERKETTNKNNELAPKGSKKRPLDKNNTG